VGTEHFFKAVIYFATIIAAKTTIIEATNTISNDLAGNSGTVGSLPVVGLEVDVGVVEGVAVGVGVEVGLGVGAVAGVGVGVGEVVGTGVGVGAGVGEVVGTGVGVGAGVGAFIVSIFTVTLPESNAIVASMYVIGTLEKYGSVLMLPSNTFESLPYQYIVFPSQTKFGENVVVLRSSSVVSVALQIDRDCSKNVGSVSFVPVCQ